MRSLVPAVCVLTGAAAALSQTSEWSSCGPIAERPVPQGDVPGERHSPAQPFPTKPPAHDRKGATEDDLIDFTPELHAESPGIISNAGQPGQNAGILVTKRLVIQGDPEVTTSPSHPRGAMHRAGDKATGKEVGAVWMPAPQSGSPVSYLIDGRQYIAVAISGGSYAGEYAAFRLPR